MELTNERTRMDKAVNFGNIGKNNRGCGAGLIADFLLMFKIF